MKGIQRSPSTAKRTVVQRPTETKVASLASGFNFLNTSHVINVEQELNTALKEPIKAASKAAKNSPRMPGLNK